MVLHILFWVGIICWLGFNLFTEIKIAIENKKNGKEKVEKKSKYIMLFTILLGLGIGIFISLKEDPQSWLQDFDFPRFISIPLVFSAFFLRFFSIQALNDFFSYDVEKKKNQRIVTTGPYRFIRHPAYLAELLGFLGIAFAFQNFIGGFFIFVFPLIAFLYRIQIEEKFLLENFGEEYALYQKKTKKIIPFVY